MSMPRKIKRNSFPVIVESPETIRKILLQRAKIRKMDFDVDLAYASLEEVNMSGNQLSKFEFDPYRWFSAMRLINVSRNQIEFVDDYTDHWEETRMTNLRVFDVSRNRLPELNITAKITSLIALYADHNQLVAFPNLPATVEVLDLGYNRIESVARERLFRLTRLRFLNLAHNSLVSVPDLASLSLLRHLSLATNRLRHLPSTMPSSIERLDFSANPISVVNNVASLTALQVLIMSDTAASTLPDLSPLSDLTDIEAAGCGIAELPDLPDSLLRIDASRNQLNDTRKLRNLLRLETLHLDANEIRDVEGLLRVGSHLRKLTLARNRIEEIDLGTLPATLELLDLADNSIEWIDLSKVGHRLTMALDGNRLECGCGMIEAIGSMRLNVTFSCASVAVTTKDRRVSRRSVEGDGEDSKSLIVTVLIVLINVAALLAIVTLIACIRCVMKGRCKKNLTTSRKKPLFTRQTTLV